MLLKAAVGSVKNITPNREKAASKLACSKAYTWASARTKRTRLHPTAARCANASTAADRSIPHYSAVWRNCPGKLERCLATATAYVQDALAGVWCKRLQCSPTKRSELQFQEVPDLGPRADPQLVLRWRGQRAELDHAEIIACGSGTVERALQGADGANAIRL